MDIIQPFFLYLQEKLLLDPMYEVPGSDIMGVCVNEDVVNKNAPPTYIRKPSDGPKSEGNKNINNENEDERVAI